MESFTFSETNSAPTALIVQLANSGSLDEISNAPDAVFEYVRHDGLTRGGRTNKALFFAIYETGKHGPQNGFRLCLVHEGFEIDSRDGAAAVAEAARPVEQGATEFVVLGQCQG